MARWFDLHEAAGRYLTESDLGKFRECCDTELHGVEKKGPTNDRVASGGVMLDWSIDP